MGIIDQSLTEIADLHSLTPDVVVICTPVDRIVADVVQTLAATPASTLVTDAGSVKATICEALQEHPGAESRFVGSHPLAGSHQSGFESSSDTLFEQRKCVVTPTSGTSPAVLETWSEFWRSLGMNVSTMSPAEHDRVLAMTSHLPHLVAAALAGLIQPEELDFAASGFRDTTRIAAGDADLWTAIFLENAQQVVAATDEMITQLKHYREAILRKNTGELQQTLAAAQQLRQLFQAKIESR